MDYGRRKEIEILLDDLQGFGHRISDLVETEIAAFHTMQGKKKTSEIGQKSKESLINLKKAQISLVDVKHALIKAKDNTP